MDAKQIIDYAYQDNGVEFRNALYSSIHDKVNAHIEAKKQEVAQSLIGQPQEPSQEMAQDTEIENT
jgi:hypothetical protein